MKKLFLGMVFLVACHSAPKHTEMKTEKIWPTTLEGAVQNPDRDAENKARDIYRHPLETLSFFEIQPGQTVVEIWPGGGWYTEILAPFLANSGHYVAAMSGATTKEGNEISKKFDLWMASHPALQAKTTLVDFIPPKKTMLAPDGTVDRIVTFRNLHNLVAMKALDSSMVAFFKALKPGGMLGVVDHRAASKSKVSAAKSGYIREEDVIKAARHAGFQLVEKSNINANSKDLKNYPNGVWTLPPSFALGEKDHDKYAAIGESDRMTLKFVKP